MFSSTNSNISLKSEEDSDDELFEQLAKRQGKFEVTKMSKKAKRRYNKKLGIESDEDDDDESIFDDEEEDPSSKKRKRKDSDEITSGMKFSKVVDSYDEIEEEEHSTSMKSTKKIKRAISDKLKHQSKLNHMKGGDKLHKEEKMQAAMTKAVKGRDENDLRVLQSKLKKQESASKKKKQKQKEEKKNEKPKKRAGFEGRNSGTINNLQNLQKLKQKVR